MSTAIERTASLVRKNLPMNLLLKSEYNPNEMTDQAFNLLVSNMEKTGITDPLLVRPLSDGRYKIIGGHHRYDGAELLGFEEVPCTIIMDPEFDDDMEKFQNVRMNLIRGKLSAKKFLALYNSMDKKYEADIMAEAFGFEDEQVFKKLVGQMSKALPVGMQEEFKKAAEEIKTVDGLTKLLNQMFAKHGSTLPYGYMLIDFGTKDSVWLRMHESDRKTFLEVASVCAQRKRGVDSLFRLFMQSIAGGKLDPLLESLKMFPEVVPETGELPLEN